MPEENDQHHCPLCGQYNACAVASATNSQTDCWCFQQKIPPPLIEKLQRAEINQRCICQRCIDQFVQQHHQP